VIFVGVYVFPDIVPPPLTIDQVPPLGFPDNSFVPVSQIGAEVVRFFAESWKLTINIESDEVLGQAPFAGTVYLTVTLVLAEIFAGVYVVPEIDPPPLTIDQIPLAGVPVNAFVPVSHIGAVFNVFLAVSITFTINVASDVDAGQVPLAGIVYRTVTEVLLVTLAGV
jgi:hypothetical protein